MSTPAQVDEARLVREIRVLVEKGDKAADKAQQFYVAASQHLKTLKQCGLRASAWEKLVKAKCGLGKSRAYELIAIADGRKTVEESRAKNASANKRLRDRQIAPSRDGKSRALTVVAGGDHGAEQPTASQILTDVADAAIDATRNVLRGREDIGPDSSGETERLRARVEELENENARLKHENGRCGRRSTISRRR
jgi:hypothetical protein